MIFITTDNGKIGRFSVNRSLLMRQQGLEVDENFKMSSVGGKSEGMTKICALKQDEKQVLVYCKDPAQIMILDYETL